MNACAQGVYTHTHTYPRQKVGKHFDYPHTEYSISCVHIMSTVTQSALVHCAIPPTSMGLLLTTAKRILLVSVALRTPKSRRCSCRLGNRTKAYLRRRWKICQCKLVHQVKSKTISKECACLPLGSQYMHGWAGGTWRHS